MAFASLIFLFGFLPLIWGSYLLLPPRARRFFLPFASLLFYAWGEIFAWILLLFLLSFVYTMARIIAKVRKKEGQTHCVLATCAAVVVLLPLLFFKFVPSFTNFPSSVFPLGLSFYTFSLLSYLWDVSRGSMVPEQNYLTFLGFATFFPALTAGPIVRYHDVRDAWSRLTPRWEGVIEGILRFVIGLSKKLIIGDALFGAYLYFYHSATPSPTVMGAWLTAGLYTLHLYYDFSGYTDMAVGLGRMFGIRLPENFRYPLAARTVSDFWRRWHMSLTNWFRNYVYIPLGGNRRGKLKTYRNLVIVWLLTGLWHGVGLHFLMWGAYFALLLCLEKAFLGRFFNAIPAFFGHCYTLIAVVFGFLLFSTSELSMLSRLFSACFGVGSVGLLGAYESYQLGRLLPLLFLAVLGATPIPNLSFQRLRQRFPRAASSLLPFSAVLLLLCIAYLNDAAFLPFEYAGF